MFVLHLALGGCLKQRPINFGITADTGGHIAYILDAVHAQADHDKITAISIVTRLFEDIHLGVEYSQNFARLTSKIIITRVGTSCRAYLEKEALLDDLPAFTQAFCQHLEALPKLPDVIHAHFADAAAVAMSAKARFGIPFVYTPHALGINKRTEENLGHTVDLRIACERNAIASAEAIIVSSHDEADNQIKAYGVGAKANTVHFMR